MRCYLMRGGHIASVEFLQEGPDAVLIKQSHTHFEARKLETPFDGFEVWDGARRVYTHPDSSAAAPAFAN
jgi:hypothetical protein